MSVAQDDRSLIRAAKQKLRAHPDLKGRWADVRDAVRRRAEAIQAREAAGQSAVPELDLQDLQNGSAEAAAVQDRIRAAGVVVIRGVVDAETVAGWNGGVRAYIEDNDYLQKTAQDDNIQQYFKGLDAQRPQMFDVYWSPAQVEARQHPHLKIVRDYLNRLWRFKAADRLFFDPTRQVDYCDRVRMREPGDTTMGLSPHLDAGSIERWVQDGYQQVYHRIFTGDWRRHNPFDGQFRTEAAEFPAPNVSTAFRTYQGWTALTRQGKGDGTLQVIPMVKESIAYLLLRALQDDVPEDDLCGATRGACLPVGEAWHADLLAGLVSIPTVEPGDTVWWHPDVVHAVEASHRGTGYSNVFFIGAAPMCEKNARYLARQKTHFVQGKTPPDFAQNDLEVDFKGRAGVDALSPLGRLQMGFE